MGGYVLSKILNISDSELEVMKIIWDNPETTSNQIIEVLEGKIDWKPNTVKTLINRLLKKEAIGFNKSGKEYCYFPIIKKDEYIKEESNNFLAKLFNGSVNSLLLNFVRNQDLSHEDIEELKSILENHSSKR